MPGREGRVTCQEVTGGGAAVDRAARKAAKQVTPGRALGGEKGQPCKEGVGTASQEDTCPGQRPWFGVTLACWCQRRQVSGSRREDKGEGQTGLHSLPGPVYLETSLSLQASFQGRERPARAVWACFVSREGGRRWGEISPWCPCWKSTAG